MAETLSLYAKSEVNLADLERRANERKKDQIFSVEKLCFFAGLSLVCYVWSVRKSFPFAVYLGGVLSGVSALFSCQICIYWLQKKIIHPKFQLLKEQFGDWSGSSSEWSSGGQRKHHSVTNSQNTRQQYRQDATSYNDRMDFSSFTTPERRKKTTPKARRTTPISNTKELQSYLQDYEQEEKQIEERLQMNGNQDKTNCLPYALNNSASMRGFYGSNMAAMHGGGSSSRFFTSSNPTHQIPTYSVLPPPEKPKSVKFTKNSDQDSLQVGGSSSDLNAAWQVFEELGLESSIHELVDNTRRLLSRHLQQFLVAFEHNVSELVELGILRSILEREILVQPLFQPTNQAVSKRNITLSDMLQQFSSEAYFMSKRRPTVNLIQEHKNFDKYLDIGSSFESKQYILHRLRTLAEDGYLGQFRWDGGGSWKGNPWTPTLPSDSVILMNVFCALLDDILPPNPLYEKGDLRPFLQMHFWDTTSAGNTNPSVSCSSSSKVNKIRGRFLICKVQGYPPHFKVVANGKVREVLPGKKNCFHAIILFLHAVKQYKSGYLGNINLHNILEQIFDTM